jgi:selenocysteine lyase/cysteine desulfurase
VLNRRWFLRSLSALGLAPLLPLEGRAAPISPPRADEPPWPAADDPRFWAKLRRHFLLPPDQAFMNTATLGSPPRAVVEAVASSMRELAATIARWDYQPDKPNWFAGYSKETPIRAKVARLVNASAEEIALLQNATMGMNFVALGLDLERGDEILQTDQEHVGAKSCWEQLAQRRGMAWKTVPLPVPAQDPGAIVDLVRRAITDRTRVIAWPHVTSSLGTVMPVAEICALARSRGIFTVVDGAQAVGQIPVDVQRIGCDAYFSSPHKWLLAPAGNGFLYLRREVADRVWTTLASGEWANREDHGHRLQQRGTGSLSLLVGLEAAIDFHNRVGPERWTRRIRELGDRLRAGLRDIPRVTISSSTHPEMCAGITTWRLEGHPPYELAEEIWRRARIRSRAVSAEWGIRTSTCIYNDEREVDRLLAAIAGVAKS